MTKISGHLAGMSGVVVSKDLVTGKVVVQTPDGQHFTAQSPNNFAHVGSEASTQAILDSNKPKVDSATAALEAEVSGASWFLAPPTRHPQPPLPCPAAPGHVPRARPCHHRAR